MKNKPYLDKLAKAFTQRHPYAVKILDANQDVDSIVNNIIADLRNQNLIAS